MTIIIRQWINFIGNSHHFHEYRWIIFHFTFIVHIYTVLFIILLNTSDYLFYVCVVNICCEYTCKIYVQCAMLLCKNDAAEEFPCWVHTQICKCFINYSAILLLLTITTRQQGLLNDGCMGAVRFCGWCCWMLHVPTGTLCCSYWYFMLCLLVLYVVGHRDYIIPPVRKDSLVADPTTSPRSPYILPPPPPETRMKVQVLTHNGSISSDTE